MAWLMTLPVANGWGLLFGTISPAVVPYGHCCLSSGQWDRPGNVSLVVSLVVYFWIGET